MRSTDDILVDVRAAVRRPRVRPGPGAGSDGIVAELQSAVRPDAPTERPALHVPPPESAMHPLEAFAARPPQAPLAVPRRRWVGIAALVPWLVGAGIVISGLLYVSQYGMRTKSEAVRKGSAAVAHMLAARDDVERMDWESAGRNLRDAREGFDAAGRELGVLGPTVTGILARIPGLDALRAGRDILRAGHLLSDAGIAISDAVGTMTNLSDAADAPGAKGISLAGAFPALEDAFTSAERGISEATSLLEGIDTADIPDDLREEFAGLRERLPHLREITARGAATVGFLRDFTGDGRSRRYLVLFQNSSELRPTGGFPGSYGILTVQNGRVTDWRADDIYNPDGQIRDLIVPPQQLQHITPGWGMRDANWFADFSVSAPKVAEFWRLGGGTAVDGVLAIRPEVLGLILDATGPITLDGYDAIITAENFLPILQSQVETDRPTGQPKRIIADLAPIVLDRLASLPGERWVGLADGFRQALDRRDILLWFPDDNLQRYADESGWSGRILREDGDYLMVNIANIAGAKADAVTATAVKLETRLQDGVLVHRLTLTRRNDGHASPYGFYNKTNRSYVRILVPEGSTLRGITGNARPAHRPLINYADRTVVRDPDLAALEATYRYDAARDVTTSAESGKTGFGFWMEVAPGATGTVQLEYAVPAGASGSPYRLLVQRQPGLDLTEFELTLDKPGLMVGSSEPALVEWPDSWRLHDTLDHDLRMTATLR